MIILIIKKIKIDEKKMGVRMGKKSIVSQW